MTPTSKYDAIIVGAGVSGKLEKYAQKARREAPPQKSEESAPSPARRGRAREGA